MRVKAHIASSVISKFRFLSHVGYMKKDTSPRPNRLSEIRTARGLTQQQLADLLEVHWVTISKLERSKSPLSDEWKRRIAEALGVAPEELLPKDQPLITIPIQGLVDAKYSRFVSKIPDMKYNVYPGLFHADNIDWYVVTTDDFRPLYGKGAIFAAYTRPIPTEAYIGRLVFAEILRPTGFFKKLPEASPGNFEPIIGYLQPPRVKDRADFTLVDGSTVHDVAFSYINPIVASIHGVEYPIPEALGILS